jgi:hypothetical protein
VARLARPPAPQVGHGPRGTSLGLAAARLLWHGPWGARSDLPAPRLVRQMGTGTR